MASQHSTEDSSAPPGGVVLPEDHSSPSSSEDSGTLHGDSPTTDNSPAMTSPISPPNISSDLSELTSSPFWRAGTALGSNPHPNSNPRTEQSSPVPAPRDLRSLRNRHAYGYAHGSQASSYSAHSFRTSRTWMSPEAQLQQEFLMVRNSMRRLFKNSDVAKWKLPEFTAHKEAMLKAKKAALDRAVKQKELEQDLQAPQWFRENDEGLRKHCFLQIVQEISNSLTGKLIPGASLETTGNISRVLGVKTIWCHDWETGKDDIAPWPSLPEMKWEGDDRAKTNCGRFLPLPREEGAQGIPWAQLQVSLSPRTHTYILGPKTPQGHRAVQPRPSSMHPHHGGRLRTDRGNRRRSYSRLARSSSARRA